MAKAAKVKVEKKVKKPVEHIAEVTHSGITEKVPTSDEGIIMPTPIEDAIPIEITPPSVTLDEVKQVIPEPVVEVVNIPEPVKEAITETPKTFMVVDDLPMDQKISKFLLIPILCICIIILNFRCCNLPFLSKI